MKRSYWVLVSIALVFTASFAFYRLSESPKTWFDEGIFLQMAKQIAHGNGISMRTAPDRLERAEWFATSGYPVLYPIALAERLGARELWQYRIPMAMYIILFVVFAFLFVKETYGKKAALAAVFLLATFGPLYGNGKNILGDIPGLAWLFLAFSFLYRLEKGARLWEYVAFGVSFGLFASSKPNFLVACIFLFIPLILLRKKLEVRGVLLTCIGLFSAVGVFFLTQYPDIPSTIAAFQTYASAPGLADVTHLSFGAMVFKNLTRFFTEAAPIYVLLVTVLWGASLFVRLRGRKTIPAVEWLAWAIALYSLFYFVRMPGFYRYFLPAHVLGLAFLPQSVFVLLEQVPGRFRRVASAASLVAFLGLVPFQAYQVRYDSWTAKFYESHRTAEFQNFVNDEARAHHVVFFAHATDIAALMPGDSYYQFLEILYLKRHFGESALPALDAGKPDTVVVSSSLIDFLKSRLTSYREDSALDGGTYLVYRKVH